MLPQAPPAERGFGSRIRLLRRLIQLLSQSGDYPALFTETLDGQSAFCRGNSSSGDEPAALAAIKEASL